MEEYVLRPTWIKMNIPTKIEEESKPSIPKKPRKKRVIAGPNYVGAVTYLLRLGKKPKEIAEFLGISTSTVSRVKTKKLMIKGG